MKTSLMTLDDNLQIPTPLPDVLAERIASYKKETGGEITPDTLSLLNAQQLTLWAYDIVRTEVMQGGFIQLIYNGYAGFIFRNPFAKMVRSWGVDQLATIINKAKKLEQKFSKDILKAETDDAFMALYEQMPQFDDCDDTFVEKEIEFTQTIAEYVKAHPEHF